MSPLSSVNTGTDQIISITSAAHAQIIEMRDQEPETDRLGLRLEIVSEPGQDFLYDLSFEITTKAAFSDEVRTHDGLKVIVPSDDIELLSGATLDYTASQGLVIRNPNKPATISVEGLTNDDAISAEVEALVSAEVNPALAAHGGFVTFVGHDGDGTAYMTMGGGCHGCSMSRQTMLDGVQTMIVEQIDGIDRVKDLTDHSTGDTPYYN